MDVLRHTGNRLMLVYDTLQPEAQTADPLSDDSSILRNALPNV